MPTLVGAGFGANPGWPLPGPRSAAQAGPSSHATDDERCHDRGLPSREPVLVKTRLAVALLIALSAPAVALAAPPATAAPASVATESPADAG